MIYVFVFQGEFGFELLNWQGVIRKFSASITPEDKIVCCSRSSLYPLYEMADEFVDISEVTLFKRSRASAYWGIFSPAELPEHRIISRAKEKFLKLLMRAQLKRFILKHSAVLRAARNEPVHFIFSAHSVRLNGCCFGISRTDGVMDIYELLDTNNNIYKRIAPDLSVRPLIEKKLGWSLEKPFLLIQTRRRDASTLQITQETMAEEPLIESLSRYFRIILLTFDTGRWLDSKSEFHKQNNCDHYSCKSFPEQACLIHHAKHCLFFTEGDFGSHLYVPPFMGRDVTAIAPRSVFQLESAPIDFWNQQVFRFGGQIFPVEAENVFLSAETIDTFSQNFMAKYAHGQNAQHNQ